MTGYCATHNAPPSGETWHNTVLMILTGVQHATMMN